MTKNFKTNFLFKLFKKHKISMFNLKKLLTTSEYDYLLFSLAAKKRKEKHSNNIYLRGLIEFTNNCKNNCYYCGIRKDNKNLKRYRLTEEEILSCCEKGYSFGIKTFVLQGGEDLFFTDNKICSIVSKIKQKFPDCTVTLSIGEKERKSYENFFKAGARRFLLREETATNWHYKKLHPKNMSLKNRKKCLFNLKSIGFVVGAGFLVNAPFQKTKHIIADVKFLEKLKPEMIGIGPFIPHKDTKFKNLNQTDLNLTKRLIAILRLLFPDSFIPTTTAVRSLNKKDWFSFFEIGANVLMHNITPKENQKLYCLYDNKQINNEFNTLKEKIFKNGFEFKN